ncbi:MAG: hypothetical protein ACYSYM_15490, partial [Planctomycetota bacterium]
MRFENLEIDPRKNQAVLETATWDPASALAAVSTVDESHWKSLARVVREDHRLCVDERCIVYAGSVAQYGTNVFFLAGLADGQHVFVELGTEDKDNALGEPIGTQSLEGGKYLSVYPTDAVTVDRYVSLIRPDKGPKALGAVPR